MRNQRTKLLDYCEIIEGAVKDKIKSSERAHRVKPCKVGPGCLVFLKVNPQVPVGELERQRKFLPTYVPKLVTKRENNNTVWLSDIYSGRRDKVATHLVRIKYLNKIIPELYLALDIP